MERRALIINSILKRGYKALNIGWEISLAQQFEVKAGEQHSHGQERTERVEDI
jgi:hypothetical protein